MKIKNFGKLVESLLPQDKLRVNSMHFGMSKGWNTFDGGQYVTISCSTVSLSNFKGIVDDGFTRPPYYIEIEFINSDKEMRAFKNFKVTSGERLPKYQMEFNNSKYKIGSIYEEDDAVNQVTLLISYFEKRGFSL
jgi:hypothetical protein